MSSKSTSTSASLSAAVGSSMMSTFASNDSALAISTICWRATVSRSTGSAGSSARPSRSNSSCAPPVQGAVVEEDARAALLAADEDVLRDREVGHQVELLVDDADALLLGVPRPVEHELVPVHAEHAGVGRVDAGEQLHERRLAGAVLAHEREHLAEAQLEAHVVERLHAGESLAHALELEERGGCRGVHRAARSGPASRTTPLRRMRLPYGRGSPVRTTSRAARARS